MSTRRSGYFKSSYKQELRLLDTPYRIGVTILALLLLLAAPHLLTTSNTYILALTFITLIGTLALNLLTGYAGQISLGHAAFMAVGAVMAHWFSSVGFGFWPTLILSTTCGTLLGFVVGGPALRLRGLYLVVATVAFHYIVTYFANEYQTRGDFLQTLTGLQLPQVSIFGFELNSIVRWYHLLLAFLLMITWFVLNLARTRPGRAWIAIRDRDIVAAALGVNVAYYKVLAFGVSAGITSLSGALLAYFIGSVSVEYFSFALAITYLSAVIIGGAGSIAGAYLGAIFISILPHTILAVFESMGAAPRTVMNLLVPIQSLIFGLVMILFLIFEPKGLIGIWNRIRLYFEMWPLRQSILLDAKRK